MCGQFFNRLAMRVIEHDGSAADRLGRAISTVFLVVLALFFIYGYLGPYVFG